MRRRGRDGERATGGARGELVAGDRHRPGRGAGARAALGADDGRAGGCRRLRRGRRARRVLRRAAEDRRVHRRRGLRRSRARRGFGQLDRAHGGRARRPSSWARCSGTSAAATRSRGGSARCCARSGSGRACRRARTLRGGPAARASGSVCRRAWRARMTQVFERWDGRGRPEGLKGEAIDRVVRLVQLAVGRAGGPAAVRDRRDRRADPAARGRRLRSEAGRGLLAVARRHCSRPWR